MNTYILKFDVYNDIDFPKGSIVTVIDPKWEFEVVEGRLKGKRGNVADGLSGWLLEDTLENRMLFKNLISKVKQLESAVNRLDKEWESLPTVNV